MEDNKKGRRYVIMKLTIVEILDKDQQCIHRTYSALGNVRIPSSALKLGETYTLVEESQIKMPRKLKKKIKKDVLLSRHNF